MAGSASDYLEKKILDLVLGAVAFTAPVTVYVALFTDSNTAAQRDANTVTEVTGGSYARSTVTNNATNFPAATGTSPASKSNGTAISFANPTANWGTVNAFGIYDALTVGNLLYWGDLTIPKTINNGDTGVSFAISTLTVTCD
jgi:hypothetical protein